MDIYLVVENGNKKTDAKCIAYSNFLHQPLGCTKATFVPMARRQSHSILIAILFQVRTEVFEHLTHPISVSVF